jgi:DNA helicase II / ATP-dependent DNA helicase PcrA
MSFVASQYQAAVFDFIERAKGSAIVRAVAGSGKTTTILHALRYIKDGASVLMLAFNAAIAKELQTRVEAIGKELGKSFVNARTFHSLGYGAVMNRIKGHRRPGTNAQHPAANLNVDANKMRKIARETLGMVDERLYSEFACRLVSLAKGQGIGALEPDLDAAWYSLVAHHDLYLDSVDANIDRGVEIARQLLQVSNDRAENGEIDFDDQLYLPLLWKMKLTQYDFVFIDEAQDTNPARRALAKLALKPGGRLIAVGDPMQAIYGFTGASHDAMDLIAAEFDAQELPLSVSYRCAREIVALAQTIVPYLEPSPSASQGAVSRLKLNVALKALKPSDAVLCRQTAPLVGLAFKLIAAGRGCIILGREIAKGLVSLIEKQRADSVEGLLEKLATYREREIARFTAKGEEQKAEGVADRCDCIETVIHNLPETERTVFAVVRKIESLFSDANGVLTLSTVHKAKGREWNTVAILEPELMPSKWARQAWQVAQERNLMYVAYTRAKEHLIFLLPSSEE